MMGQHCPELLEGGRYGYFAPSFANVNDSADIMRLTVASLLLGAGASAVSVSQINGKAYLSPYKGQNVFSSPSCI